MSTFRNPNHLLTYRRLARELDVLPVRGIPDSPIQKLVELDAVEALPHGKYRLTMERDAALALLQLTTEEPRELRIGHLEGTTFLTNDVQEAAKALATQNVPQFQPLPSVYVTPAEAQVLFGSGRTSSHPRTASKRTRRKQARKRARNAR